MNSSAIDSSKKKFPHTSSTAVFTATFFNQDKICYFIQCESGEVLIGEPDEKFKLLWKGTVKQKVLCIQHCHKHNIIYAGTAKGTIAVINYKNDQEGETKIDAINGEPILAIFSYIDEVNNKPELIAVNKEGILRRYVQNKYVSSVNLPFKVIKAVSNKAARSKNDISMILVKEKGTTPYIFSAVFLTSLFDQDKSPEKISKLLQNIESKMVCEPDQQINSEQISCIALSNSKAVLAIAVDCVITIYTIVKNQEIFSIIPDFKFKEEEKILNIDLIDTSLLFESGRGISTYDVERRKKIARGLIFKASQYDIVHWAELPYKIVYGSFQSSKMKILFSELKPQTGAQQ